jgi:hypothetical protein
MGSAARRRGAYGGEYLREEFRLRTQGGRRKAKELVKTRQKVTGNREPAADQNHPPRPTPWSPIYGRTLQTLGSQEYVPSHLYLVRS